MKITLVTGASGAGKSQMLHALKREKNIFYVDPLAVDLSFHAAWSTPGEGVEGVVFDHIIHMVKPSAQIREAMAWCEANDVPLYLCDQERDEIEALNIVLPVDTPELNVRGISFNARLSTPSYNGNFSLGDSSIATDLQRTGAV